MDPLMRVVLTVVGALIGAGMADPGARLIDAIIGAVLGFGLAEFSDLRSQLNKLEGEVKRLRAELRPPPPMPPPVTVAPIAATPEPAAAPHASLPRPQRQPQRPPPSGEVPLITAIRGFFTGGNAMVRVGVIVLFFGVAFLLRYMAEHTRVPIEYRLSGVAVGSMLLLVLGWRLRAARRGYALALQGGGVAILYLTVFGALRLYGVLPAAAAFPLLACVAVLSAVLAILQDSLWLALLGVSGGFLAPVLASTGEGSHVALFGYYAILNFGILAVAWFKAWRPLNIAGFIFTFAVGTIWGVLRYRAEDFASIEPFLVLYFLFYLGIAILFTLRQPAKLTGYVDGALIFGTPIVVFTLQSGMLHEELMRLAYSAVAMGAVYLLAALLLKRRRDESQNLLIQAFIAVGVAFLTLAAPLALDARWNTAAWALEGSALVWVGCRQSRVLPRISGGLLNLAAGLVLSGQFDMTLGHALLAPAAYPGLVTVAGAALFSARTLRVHREVLREYERTATELLFCWALLWWVVGGLNAIPRYVPEYRTAAQLLFATVTASLSSELNRRLEFAAARMAALMLWPVMLGFAAHAALTVSHPLVQGGWLSWTVAFAGAYLIMHRQEGAPRSTSANVLNSLTTWLCCALSSWELSWELERALPNGPAWADTAWIVVPAVVLLMLPKLVTRIDWPFARNRDTYLFVTGIGLALFSSAWSLASDLSPGGAAPLPYLPLLNPLDIAQALVLLIMVRYWRFLRAVRSPGFARTYPRLPAPMVSILAFLWLTAVLLRTLHHWWGVAFDVDSMADSTLVQTSLSIFWAVLALIATLVATRQGWRIVWLVGAALLAVVTAKLFLVDLSKVGSIERIVSFVGVGILMLVVGYFSPLPPAHSITR